MPWLDQKGSAPTWQQENSQCPCLQIKTSHDLTFSLRQRSTQAEWLSLLSSKYCCLVRYWDALCLWCRLLHQWRRWRGWCRNLGNEDVSQMSVDFYYYLFKLTSKSDRINNNNNLQGTWNSKFSRSRIVHHQWKRSWRKTSLRTLGTGTLLLPGDSSAVFFISSSLVNQPSTYFLLFCRCRFP